MFKNYFKTAWRNLVRNKTFGFINIFGMAVSMSVCMLIILIINDQKSYDNFISNHDRVYRVHTKGKGDNTNATASSAFPLATELRNFSNVEASATLFRNLGGDLFYKEQTVSGDGFFADDNLFKVLDYKLKEGNAATALSQPRSLVISQEIAKVLFGNDEAMGKVVTLNHTGVVPTGNETGFRGNTYGQFLITGVLQKNPGKTTLPFKMLASLSTVTGLAKDSLLQSAPDDWDNVWTSYTYVLLKKGRKEADLQYMLNTIASKKYPTTNGSNFIFTAAALKNIPGELIGNQTVTTLPNVALIFLAILCIIIMLCACLNYTNLSVARSLTRVKEVGVRKVSGATQRQVFQQFIIESVFTSFIALLFAFLLLLLLQPLFTGLWLNRFFDFSFHYTPKVYTTFFVFSLIVGLVAGLLPAAYICLFNPVQIFRNLNAIKGFRGLTLRKVLLVTQFIVSLIFVISATLIYAQTKHVFNFDYGFNKDNVVNIKLYKAGNYDRFAQAISSNRNVIAASACTFPPSSGSNNTTLIFKADNKKDSLQTGVMDIDGKCLDVWNIPLVAGKNLPVISPDSVDQFVLINQKMISAFGYPSANAAVGQRLWLGDNTVQIAGVVKDFQYLDVTRGIEPLLLRNRKREFGWVTVRIAANNEAATVQFLQTAWKKVNPDTKFDYMFFDDQLHEFHSMLSDAASIIGFLSLIAVAISCLGLLGMALYTAETRRKEVAIRKVLGSGVLQIIFLLSKNYLVLLGIAILIATPIAYMLNNAWLQFFASRVSITPLILCTGISGLSFICFCIVGLQGWRVSRGNPAKSLRSE
ncbi:MAG: FtsX-like permease family protein [Parafilimonas sp.]